MANSYATDVIEVDFDQSMGKQCKESFERFSASSKSSKRYAEFKNIYYSNLPSGIKPRSTPLIPKIIHQIWLGKAELPSLYLRYQQEWKKLHPDWNYILWTENEIDKLEFSTKELYAKSKDYLEKADLVRYEVLNKFGGVYADFDVEPKINLDSLIYKYEFFAGLEPSYKQYKVQPVINNGFMGSIPLNSILIATINKIKNSDLNIDHASVTVKTMLPLTEAFLENYQKLNHVIAFPVTYTQPKQFKYTLSKRMVKKWYRKLFDNCDGNFSELKPETIAFHNIGKEQ
jgi:mannosyltransferase OCH1-like enzyme